MQYSVTTDAINTLETDCLVVAVFEEGDLSPSAALINSESDGIITRIIERGDMNGNAGQTVMLNDLGNISSPRVLLVGCGKKDKTTEVQFTSAITAAIKVLEESGAESAHAALAEVNVNNRSHDWTIRHIITTAESAQYKYTATKATKAAVKPLVSLTFSDINGESVEQSISRGQSTAAGMTLARELGNLPGNICTPSYLADQAIQLGENYATVKTTILDEPELEALGMGSFLSVSRGSRQPAKLITLEYTGAVEQKPVVLVGKGLTFDAGGISLKPSQGMDEMKYDMCGSASVLGTIRAIAEMNIPINVVGIIPSSENLPDGDANKPGDIVTSMAGKTIEILNTDAEGRLLLCDALTYSERFDPAVVIDIATLTGAIIVALGNHATGLMANNQSLADELLKAGQDSFDRVWQLPLWDDYQQQLDSNFADIANVGGKEAGSVTAACFLSRFTEKYNWAHLDIAGTAWVSGKAKGATGRPVPLLVQYLLNRIEAA
jgi:leucyl aminopeptidase